MKKFIILSTICLANFTLGQTINFKGCVPLFENQTFIFNKTQEDSFGKKIYVTTPVTGDQPCGGLGVCEFKLQWNDPAGRWEFLADKGDGNFINPHLIYYSSTGNSSATNPPNIAVGNWIENISLTEGNCNGNLTKNNGTMTGDVRTTTLAVNELRNSNGLIYPNPATNFISIVGIKEVKSAKVISLDGRLLQVVKDINKINISTLTPGVYLLEIETDKKVIPRIKFIKN